MKIPQLKKKSEIKTCHNCSWEDNYSWIHQDNILEVLKDSKKLNPEVRKYLEEENSYTDFHLRTLPHQENESIGKESRFHSFYGEWYHRPWFFWIFIFHRRTMSFPLKQVHF